MLHLYREYLIDTKHIDSKKESTTNIVYQIDMNNCDLKLLAKFSTLKLAKSYIDYIIEHIDIKVTDMDLKIAKSIATIINVRANDMVVDIDIQENRIFLLVLESNIDIPITEYITQVATHQATKEYIVKHLTKICESCRRIYKNTDEV